MVDYLLTVLAFCTLYVLVGVLFGSTNGKPHRKVPGWLKCLQGFSLAVLTFAALLILLEFQSSIEQVIGLTGFYFCYLILAFAGFGLSGCQIWRASRMLRQAGYRIEGAVLSIGPFIIWAAPIALITIVVLSHFGILGG